MSVTVVVGAQWGDEGKGRVVDYLAARADLVIRFQGGDNAGHTVVNDFGRFALHLIPCGIFYPGVRNLLGAGTVVNLDTVSEEMALLQAAGVSTDNLWIELRAHLIWPYHRLLDGAEEDRRKREAGDEGEEMGPFSKPSTRSSFRSSSSDGGLLTLPVSIVERYGLENPTFALTSSKVSPISSRLFLNISPKDIMCPFPVYSSCSFNNDWYYISYEQICKIF